MLLGTTRQKREVFAAGIALPAGAGAGKVAVSDAAGNISWVDASTLSTAPTGAAGGDLAGTFPNPTIGANKVTQAKASVGTGSTQLAGGDDARFPTTGQKNALTGADGTPGTGTEYLTIASVGARVPALVHASRHAKGGADAVSLGAIATAVADLPSWLVDAVLPWSLTIFTTAVPDFTSGTWVTVNVAASVPLKTIRYNSGGVQNDEIGWNVTLAAGTYEVAMLTRTNANHGIATLRLDQANWGGTIDAYSATQVDGVLLTPVGGLTVGTTGKHLVGYRMATKNAFSSGYFAIASALFLRRTA